MSESPEQLKVKKLQEDMEEKPEDLEMQPEDGPETPEKLKEFVQKKIKNAEEELKDLSEFEERIKACNRTVNLPPDKVEKIKKTFDVVEKLKTISKETGSLLAALIIAMGSVDANITRANDGSKVKGESRIEEVVENKDKEKENAESYNKKIAELKESVYKDNHEKFTIVSINNGNLEFAESAEEKNFGNVDFEKIETAIKNGSEKIEIIHTHPLEGYPNYSQKEIEEIREGKSEPSPHPPSVTDLASLMQELNYFKTDNKRIENKIIDPTGEWIFKIGDENNYFIKKYSAFLEKYTNPEVYKTTLNETEKNDFQKKGSLIDITHPEYRVMYFPDKIKKMMLDDFRKDFPDKEWFDLFGEDKSAYAKNFAETKDLALETSQYDANRTEEEEDTLIKKYIEKCKKIGIDVSYKPFKDKER